MPNCIVLFVDPGNFPVFVEDEDPNPELVALPKLARAPAELPNPDGVPPDTLMGAVFIPKSAVEAVEEPNPEFDGVPKDAAFIGLLCCCADPNGCVVLDAPKFDGIDDDAPANPNPVVG